MDKNLLFKIINEVSGGRFMSGDNENIKKKNPSADDPISSASHHLTETKSPTNGETTHNGGINGELLLEVLTSLNKGDLSNRMPAKLTGIEGKIADTLNEIIDRHELMLRKLEKANKQVGKKGKLDKRISSDDFGGSWDQMLESVNQLIDDLVWPEREMARVINAVAEGDFTQKMETDRNGESLKGEYLRSAKTVNAFVEQLDTFNTEISRVTQEMGSKGKLGGQAEVKGVSGAWKELTDNVNLMASNVTGQVRSIAEVTTAMAKGDLSKKIGIEAQGEFLELKETINSMVGQLDSFTTEVTRVAREIGGRGKLGGQAIVKGLSGAWKNLTDQVNLMADNLTEQVRNVAEVTEAVTKGDLSKKVSVSAQGEVLELKETINTMVDQLDIFTSEVMHVTHEMGFEGKLGKQANVAEVSGVWKDMTDHVNRFTKTMAAQMNDVSKVVTALAHGDLEQKVTIDAHGEMLHIKKMLNHTVETLSIFSSEITRVALDVGTDGKLGGQVKVKDALGTWKEMIEDINQMVGNLTVQLWDVSKVARAIERGDLSKRITVDADGEMREIKETLNNSLEILGSFTSEVNRVVSEIASEGILGGQADVPGAAGAWKDVTENVNLMSKGMSEQLRDVSNVSKAIAKGDLNHKITVKAQGEVLELKNTINVMVDHLGSFASEIKRVSREMGTKGKLGGQANLPEASGTWKELTENINLMSENLTEQLRDVSKVAGAVAQGDLTKKITVDAQGEIQELKETINTMVDQLGSFASEVTRVAREVGTKGKLGGQADVPGVSGTWEALTDNVNQLAGNLTVQLRDISKVAGAVARGDLTKKITVDAQGEIQELKETINTMVDQLGSFASEVTRVAREVGTEGKLGGQADVPGVSGTWKNLTDNVNLMADNLTDQVRSIAEVTTAVAKGDLSKKITITVKGEIQELKETINTMVDQLGSFASEVTRVAREVGTEGKLGGQAKVKGVSGTWKDLTDNVNQLAGNLTVQLRDVSKVATAIAQGDLGQKITVDAQGEILQIKETINTMVDQLGSFASEVTRVAREVGTEGKLGGQARVSGVSGTWKDLTENVNLMADNLTDQVRGIAEIVTAVANGDLTKKLTVEAKGEIASLADTINDMIDTLAIFTDQVTTVAREVGTEGKLGGQADVPGASGNWKDLTNNVNQLADNLTTQVRAIADVATAVTEGDLTRSVTVEARGEVEELKNSINEMIRNLKETTQQNREQDWLKTNLAKFSRMLQGQKDLLEVSRLLLSELAPVVSVQHAVFYGIEPGGDSDSESGLKLLASYGYREQNNRSKKIEPGEGLIGQCAIEKERILLTNVPGDYIQINSGLGEAPPLNIAILPVLFEGEVKGVMELASFDEFNETHLSFLEQLTESIGIVLNTIEATMRTERLLEQSQSLAGELQNQQEELQQTNEELEEKARLLVEQKVEVETKNREVEFARQELEEKAEQLELTSKYKSEFLANMSHELRTPLNSLLILSRQLRENKDNNLTSKQMEFIDTIQSAGSDLLSLINDILDLSKIESGTVTVEAGNEKVGSIKEEVVRTFQHMAEVKKDLSFSVDVAKGTPEAINIDRKRLMQILKNLLSNSFKFTSKGDIRLEIDVAEYGWSSHNKILNQAEEVLAFTVTDTGIGIPPEKQKVIFEAFQQADGSTSRKYGGSGLGLAISREIADLIGGELRLVKSEPEEGSTFTLFVPQAYTPNPKNGETRNKKKLLDPPKTSEKAPKPEKEATPVKEMQPENRVEDDREDIGSDDRVLLIVDNAEDSARKILETAHDKDFKGVITLNGEETLVLAKEHNPTGIILNTNLEDIDAWTVLDRLKLDAHTRHIPVSIISDEKDVKFGLKRGAFAHINMPAGKKKIKEALDNLDQYVFEKARRLLIVEGDEKKQKQILKLLGKKGLEITAVDSGKMALKALDKQRFDCMVMDLNLEDVDEFEVIDIIQEQPELQSLPIIIYTDDKLKKAQETKLKKAARDGIIKSVHLPERLLDETALFLHREVETLPKAKRDMIKKLYETDDALKDKKVLVVDDDVRNIFALTSILEQHELEVISAENGKVAIEMLEENSDLDLILMDIMMPEMDGFETMGQIRKQAKFKTLPIIALTAKAMKGDREKCLRAGASDYITKPVDTDQLLALLRVWLYR